MTPPGINRKQTLLWAGVGAAIVGLLWLLGPTLSPFMLGLVLAYIFEPLVERLSRQRVPRTLAVVLVIALAILWLTWWLIRAIYEPLAGRSARLSDLPITCPILRPPPARNTLILCSASP